MDIDPRSQAEADWQQRKACSLVWGELRHPQALLDKKTGLYLSFFERRGAGDEAFVEAYNTRIGELLTEHGLPDWAPGRRLPDRQDLLRLMEQAKPRIDYQHKSIREKRLVEIVEKAWAQQPQWHVRVEDRGLLLLGGDVNSECGRIDVVDVEMDHWMASEEYLRRHVAQFPWDKSR